MQILSLEIIFLVNFVASIRMLYSTKMKMCPELASWRTSTKLKTFIYVWVTFHTDQRISFRLIGPSLWTLRIFTSCNNLTWWLRDHQVLVTCSTSINVETFTWKTTANKYFKLTRSTPSISPGNIVNRWQILSLMESSPKENVPTIQVPNLFSLFKIHFAAAARIWLPKALRNVWPVCR